MLSLQWWMRLVGAYYLLAFVGVMARAPIRAEGPPGVLERAITGDGTARFVVDTWTALGLLLGVIGATVLYFSTQPNDARAVAQMIVAMELAWGIPIDVYKIARGYPKRVLIPWLVVHAVVIATGILALGAQRAGK
jgi:hypothetical protein